MSTHENDIEILWLSQNGYYPTSRIVPHRHPDYYQFYFTQSGRGQFLLDTETYPFESGMFFLVHPDELHGLSDFTPSEGETVSVFELKFFIHNQNLAEELERIRKPVRETADLSAEFTKIFREAVQKEDFYEQRLPHLLVAWIYRFINVWKNSTCAADRSDMDPMSPAARIRSYLDLHYMEDISLDRIAQDMDYSKNYLCRLFREGTGMTITEYLNDIRIFHAKDLLMKMRYSIAEVSRMCGFHSIYYFNKVFKDSVGIPPGAFRRSEIAGISNLQGPVIATNTTLGTSKIFTAPYNPGKNN